VHYTHTDGRSSGIKQEAVHRLIIASEASLLLLISSQVFLFLFCFVAFVFPFFLPEFFIEVRFVDHAKKSSPRTSSPALYKQPNRQETREAQDRSTESID
jgi:hypothetical protein